VSGGDISLNNGFMNLVNPVNTYKIGNIDKLLDTALGLTVIDSSLQSVGILRSLTISGGDISLNNGFMNLVNPVNTYKIGNVDKLLDTALGLTVIDSSLQSVGTLRSLTVSGGTLNIYSNISQSLSNINIQYGDASSFQNNTTGIYNTAIGIATLNKNTTGGWNTATGYSALNANTTGYSNVATGINALTSNTTGYSNVATGRSALYSNTSGYNNVATGYQALYYNTSGYSNTATGRSALYSNTTGYRNVATGYAALYYNTSGYNNVATGYYTGFTDISGSNNLYMGYSAGRYAKNDASCIYIGVPCPEETLV
jgi:hypothetical protein